MKLLFPIEVDIRQLLKLVKPQKQKPVQKHFVGTNPADVPERWWHYWFNKTEPADAWQIE